MTENVWVHFRLNESYYLRAASKLKNVSKVFAIESSFQLRPITNFLSYLESHREINKCWPLLFGSLCDDGSDRVKDELKLLVQLNQKLSRIFILVRIVMGLLLFFPCFLIHSLILLIAKLRVSLTFSICTPPDFRYCLCTLSPWLTSAQRPYQTEDVRH